MILLKNMFFLLKRLNKTVKNEAKEQKGGFSSMLIDIWSLFRN